MTKEILAQQIYQAAYLEGQFKLRSGQISNHYFDKYRFEARPELLRQIAERMIPLIPPGTQVLAGLEMGGIPIATALSLSTGIPCAFVRKKAKDYGTCQVVEGLDIHNKKVCIIEDVITTGGQVILSAQDLRQLGAEISTVLCVIDRGGGREKLAESQLEMKALFTMEDLLPKAK